MRALSEPIAAAGGEVGADSIASVRPPTLQDVADRAGVHRATASRALNPATRHLVNRVTAERVEKVAKAMGYRPSPVTRTPKPVRTATVGLMLPDQTMGAPIVQGISDVLGSGGYSTWILSTGNDPRRESIAVESMRSGSVDGFIVATARREYPLLDQLVRTGRPVVLVDRCPDRAAVASVTADDETGMALAVRYLVHLGHSAILHLAGPQDISTGVNRLRAFERALAGSGVDAPPPRVVISDAWTETAGAEAMDGALRAGLVFTAVLAASDPLALGALEALGERGLTCPGDVSVVGFDDMPYVDRLNPPLTTVRVPHYEMGAEAARLLLEALKPPPRPDSPGPPAGAPAVRLPVTLIVRGSTAAASRPARPAPRPRRQPDPRSRDLVNGDKCQTPPAHCDP